MIFRVTRVLDVSQIGEDPTNRRTEERQDHRENVGTGIVQLATSIFSEGLPVPSSGVVSPEYPNGKQGAQHPLIDDAFEMMIGGQVEMVVVHEKSESMATGEGYQFGCLFGGEGHRLFNDAVAFGT